MSKAADILSRDDADLELERPRATLAEIAADKLREFILLEKLPPGAAISERDVAAALGISRTPLKSALALLEQEGLVEYSVTRRPRVADPSLNTIIESLTVMGALEALAGGLACASASQSEIEEVADLVRQMREGSDRLPPLEFFRTDMRMHDTIVRASGNRALMVTHRQYNARLWRARFVSSRRKAGRAQTLAEHEAIAAALAARDEIATAAALKTHLSSAVQNIKSARADREHQKAGS
ncbi:MAG: GntR family transcriptional regulator [Pseudomonadota bacterium]